MTVYIQTLCTKCDAIFLSPDLTRSPNPIEGVCEKCLERERERKNKTKTKRSKRGV
jgi:hypothetical protein